MVFSGPLMQTSILARPMRAGQEPGGPLPGLWSFLPIAALGFTVWQTIGLVKLKSFNRWFAVVFFIWWAICLIWKTPLALRGPNVKLLPAVLLFSMLIVLNLLSAWYLSRRSFREFSVQFAAERKSEDHFRMMQKASQKKILDERRK
jgi:hypothetical protein